ncbi:S-type pyocin domain-containing protein [Pseudomonas sp. LS1212]|uniref:S-type pyocin domain-containing protein n=1 Tax=Pseudomonas sp. LS1212 TaxID=2972478 RepID=UPI00215C3303|nr:S-type pyocin domain-containing protein [Pseudomonas sp. LS1212]UVJ45633.1 S-type pyocin domain-containing protein [Pseudomonas sp. LS1212]
MCGRKVHEIPAIHIGAQPPPGIDPIGGGFSQTSKIFQNNSHFGFQPAVGMVLHKLRNTVKALAEEYKALSNQLPQTIEYELAATRLEGQTNPLPPAESIIRELGVRNKLLLRKTAEFHNKTAIANGFYGSDPINTPLQMFYKKALTMEKRVGPDGIAMRAWQKSYRAAHDARLLSQTIQLLNQQSVNVQNRLRVVQAEDQARLAVEREAQRAAAEQARIAAEAEVKRLAAEKARIAAEAEAQRLAAEKARIAAEAEAQRLAAEQARIAAEAEAQRLAAEQALIAAEAEAQRLAAEQARVAAEAEAQRLAAEQARVAAEAEAQRLAAEQARVAAEAETQRVAAAEQARLEALAEDQARPQPRTFANSGSMAAVGPVFTATTGSVITNTATSLALRNALRAAVSAAIGALVTAATPVIVGFAALLAPSRLGNSDLYSVSVPLSELAPDLTEDLHGLAAVQGEVNLRVSLGSRRIGNQTQIVVATTDGVSVPSTVPVRLAQFDPQKKVYVSTSTGPQSVTTTWTPVVESPPRSTESPAAETDLPVYEGATATPDEGRIDTFPQLDQFSFGGFITVFPAESGIPPLYVVFNSPYDGATATGEHSGRDFNPDQAGGPIVELDWKTAMITQEGIDAVKLHTARLDQSDANDIMIERLEKILKGDLDITDTDRRYYTHEIRELERFRGMGLSDDFKPQNGSSAWNNAHTATLEDYKLNGDEMLLYSNEAIQAGDKQINRIYEQLLKGVFE